MKAAVVDNKDVKAIFSEEYNYIYRKDDGFFMRWGRTKADNPSFSPLGPELLDISITSKCLPGTCKYCYQNAKKDGKDMSLGDLSNLLDGLPPTVCQIALGGGEPTLHPDFGRVLQMIRAKGIVPNYTTNGENLTDVVVEVTAKYCGAVATSYHGNWFTTLNSVKRFSEAGMDQTNVHFVLSEETIDEALNILNHVAPGLFENVNAVVFLLYKPQGRAPKENILQNKEKISRFMKAVRDCKEFKVGFDSCSVPLLYEFADGKKDLEMLSLLAESCESSLFSYYIDVDGKGYPCSFSKSHIPPIDTRGEGFDFMRDLWYNDVTNSFRRRNVNSTATCMECKHDDVCGRCVLYPDITVCENKGKEL